MNTSLNDIKTIDIVKSILIPEKQDSFINEKVLNYFLEENNKYSIYLEKIEIIKNFYGELILLQNTDYELYQLIFPRYIYFLKENNLIEDSLEHKTIVFNI